MQAGAVGVDAVTSDAVAVQQAFGDILAAARQLEERNQAILDVAAVVVQRSHELQARMEDTSAIAEENSAAAAEMSSTAAQVRGGLATVSHVTEQNAASAEAVSAATEEMSAQLDAVTDSAQLLQQLAANLEELVDQFQIGDEEPEQFEQQAPSRTAPAFGHTPAGGSNGHGHGNGHSNGNGNGNGNGSSPRLKDLAPVASRRS
jgi:methyl-accepting chemotaxis protein